MTIWKKWEQKSSLHDTQHVRRKLLKLASPQDARLWDDKWGSISCLPFTFKIKYMRGEKKTEPVVFNPLHVFLFKQKIITVFTCKMHREGDTLMFWFVSFQTYGSSATPIMSSLQMAITDHCATCRGGQLCPMIARTGSSRPRDPGPGPGVAAAHLHTHAA